MPHGHHGANHPVQDLNTGKVIISSQNHNYALDPDHMPKDLKVTHISLFDKTIQGITHTKKEIVGIQGHPEAGPGPLDWQIYIEQWLLNIRNIHA